MRADVEYKDIINSNEELSAFLTDLRNTLKDSVSEELAAQVVAESGETETETEAETETETEALENVTQIVAANDVVNIRSSDSETADKLGKVEVGQQFTLLENRGNGWSKIDYNGKEAFIKTEFLTVVETQETGNNAEDGNDAETVNNGNAQNNQTAENDGPSDPTGKTVIVKESVNVRKSANENGERIATVYRGEVLEVIMKQADGWTKIKYNGQTAYVKSDYVE